MEPVQQLPAKRIKRINSHVGLSRYMDTLQDTGKVIARIKEIPSPYRYGPDHMVYRTQDGQDVFIVETAHKQYDIFVVPPTAKQYSSEEELFADMNQQKQSSKTADMIHSDNELAQKMEPATPAPEAGPSQTELVENSHAENGASPVLDGDLHSPERANVNAIREALETQQEMEVGKPIGEKVEELKKEESMEIDAKPGKQIIINIANKVAFTVRGKSFETEFSTLEAKAAFIKAASAKWSDFKVADGETKVSDYNGWTNWETWHVNLLIDNTESTLTTSRNLCKAALRKAKGGEVDLQSLIGNFKRLFRKQEKETLDHMHEAWPQEVSDGVNWEEIAKSQLDDAKEAVEYEKKNPKPKPSPEEKRKEHMQDVKRPGELKLDHPDDEQFMKDFKIKMNSQKPPAKGSPEWHQLQIALKTMKMPDAMLGVMGGPSKEEAAKTLARYGLRWDEGDYMAGGKGVKRASQAFVLKKKAFQIETRITEGKMPDALEQIVKKLNERFQQTKATNPRGYQDAFEQRLELNCMEVAQELGLTMHQEGESLVFSDAAGKNFKPTAAEGEVKTETELEKEAAVNLFFPGQVTREFYPELMHSEVDYPNMPQDANSPMLAPEMTGDGGHDLENALDAALNPSLVEAVEVQADPMEMEAAASTSPAGGMGIGRDGKPQVLEGAPLRKENDIRGPGFLEEFHTQYDGISGDALRAVAKKVAAADEQKQFSMFLKKVMGEIVATMIAAFKVTSRPLLDKVPGVGEVQLANIEQPAASSFNVVNTGSRVKYLLEKLNDSEVQDAINDAWAQGAVWHDGQTGGFVYEVFARPESIDTDSMIMKYKFIAGTKE